MKILIIPAFIITLLAWQACCNCNENKNTNKTIKGNYFGQTCPTEKSQIFAPDYISTTLYERDAAYTPYGNEFYFTIMMGNVGTIVYVNQKDSGWSQPEIVSFSGKYSDIEPFITNDGKKLFFSSNRPTSDSLTKQNYNIWYVERTENAWGAPVNLGDSINTIYNEFYPTLADNGNLYFCAEYPSGKGAEDIYCSKWMNGSFSKAKILHDSINTPSYEYNAMIAPDESYIIYTTHGYGDGYGRGDLWVSFNKQNYWSKPTNLGAIVNSTEMDYCPALTQLAQEIM